MVPFDADDDNDGEDGFGDNDDNDVEDYGDNETGDNDDNDVEPAQVWVVPFNAIIEDCHRHSLSAVTCNLY